MDEDNQRDIKIKLKKKRKEETIITDNLDNNATPEKIIEFLQATLRKNKAALLYCQTVRQRRTNKVLKTKHYQLVGHPLNNFSEDWDGGLRPGFFDEFPHRNVLPKMISKIRNINKKDPVTEYMNKKMMWHDTMTDYRRIMSLMSKKRPYEWINDDILYCPKQLVNIAQVYEQDPDRYFDSSYNWYYAGQGNLHSMDISGKGYLLQSELTCLYVLPFDKYNLVIDYDNVAAKFDCENDIFETIYTQNLVALRTKNKIFILKLFYCNDQVQIEKLKELQSVLPFTGISFDEFHKNIMYVITLDFKLTIVNIDRMAGRSRQLKGTVTSLTDNWSTVIGSERGYFTHVSKQAVTLYDKRSNKAFQRWKNLHYLTDDRNCNDISVAKHYKGKPFLYFGTNHHLFMMDMRHNKTKDSKLRVVQRWTHGMQCFPTYMTISDNFEYDKVMVCVTSQWCEDMCVISNYADRPSKDFDVRSVTMPYRPPSILQALNEAKQKRLCCDLQNPIDDRLCTSITGLSVVEDGDNYHVLMSNSLGDISSHTLCPRHMTAFFEDNSSELLNEWSTGYKKETKVLEVSAIRDICSVWGQLKRIPDDYKLGENKKARKVYKFSEDEIYESFNKEELESGLLDVWTKNSTEEHMDTKDESSFNLFFCDDDDEIKENL